MAKLRLGFVGGGFMGQLAHLANYALLPEVELVGLAEGRTKLAERVAARYGVAQVYPDHRALLADAQVEAVVAILPFALHQAVVPELLAAGKHVLTEKPICIQPAHGRELADLAAQGGLVYYVGYQKRSDPGTQYVKALAHQWRQSGELGKLRYLRVCMPPGPWALAIESPLGTDEPAPNYGGQRAEGPPPGMDEAAGRLYISFVNYYIHQVNLMRHLLGEDYQVRYADPAGLTFTAESASGITCLLEMAPYHTRDHWTETYTLCFDQGFIELDLPAPLARQQAGRVRIFRGKDRPTSFEQPLMPPQWAFGEQAKRFVAAVRGDEPTLSPAAEAVKDLETAEQYLRLLLAARGAA